MALSKIFRSVFAVVLTCVIALSGFTGLAFADTGQRTNVLFEANSLAFTFPNPISSIDSLVKGFWQGLGGIIGTAAGTVLVCYTVDVAIAPVAPPVAAYLTPMCPAIGAVAGGGTGLIVASPK
ncbi:MAG: hypothetical protein ACKPE3_02165 [Sphaerospermopsis kisseleviana]